MKILALNTSHRGDQGQTHLFLDLLFHGAGEAGAECGVVTLARLKINRCLSCYRCQTGEPHLVCAYDDKDEMRGVLDRMAAADILIFATPIYLMNMTGLLKNFLDRLYSTMDVAQGELSDCGLIHHHINPAISSKPFVTMVVSSNIERESWQSVPAHFRTYARFMNAPQVGVLVLNAAGLFGQMEDPEVSSQFPRLAKVCQAYEQAGRELATLGRVRPSTQRRTNQEIVSMPFFGLLKHLRPVKRRVLAVSDAMWSGTSESGRAVVGEPAAAKTMEIS
jgi:NAD(P)H-dependent FMN reductase